MNDKQRRFVEEYLIDLNATQAAIRAGYSAKTASSQGERLLRHVEVSAAILEQKRDRSDRTKVDADWLLSRLALEAEADLADLYDDNGDLRPVKEWPLIWRQGLIQGVETVREGKGEDFSIVDKVKISDRTKRLELIGKHVDVQAFKDRVEHSGGITVVVDAKDAAL
ncbi:terminase small subunit [Novosphingobium aureum]|uniref:terminase small subunit n=1 Tax=Novosphingobium aureum TaxID=2792964 RepID=UPI002B4758A7|nr:terminase small subunit [Novosphingobium aureum]